MTKFQVLLVDDEEVSDKDKIARLENDERIDLVAVGSLEEAREQAANRFFHLALVDMQLDANNDSNVDGQYFLRELHDGRPTCRRILFTSTADEHRDNVFGLADPNGPLIHGAIDKADSKLDWLAWLRERANERSGPELEIEGLDLLADLIPRDLGAKPVFGGLSPQVTKEELEYVIASLFDSAQGGSKALGAGAKVPRVELRPLPGGESSAVVFLARLVSRDELGAVTCVVKVAPRSESREERDRYESFARFRVSTERRAELLGSCLGDTVGAAAYAFVGRSPDEIGDLAALYEAESAAALPMLERLFEHEKGDLWRVLPDADSEDLPADLGKYFSEAYGLDARAIGKKVEDHMTDQAPRFGLIPGKKAFESSDGSGKLELPNASFYGGAKARRSYHAGVIHGDLNATNVLILDDERVRLIDFRHARVGPIATDFAAQETSVRLSGDLEALFEDGLLALLEQERRAAMQPWRKPPPEGVPADAPPFWMTVSAHLGGLCRSLSDDKVSAAEYWATNLQYALRVFRSNKLGSEKRLRLAVWIAALHWALSKDASRRDPTPAR